MTDNKTVDSSLAYEGFAFLANHNGNPIQSVQYAYNQAAKRVAESGRTPVLIQVLVRVAPQELDFESDAPLSGGVCDMTPGCESCQ